MNYKKNKSKMYWIFTVLVYANIGSVKMKILWALVVSLTVDRLSIVFSSLFSTLGIFVDLKKPQILLSRVF